MILNWYGEASFRVQTGGIDIAVDPLETGTGLNTSRFKAAVILDTKGPIPRPYASQKATEEHYITGPGEYEVKGIEIHGIAAPPSPKATDGQSGTIYIVRNEEITVAFLGYTATTDFSPDTLELLQSADILCVPVGGDPYLDAAAAANLVKKVESRIVIPTCYAVPDLKRKALGVEPFLKLMGQKPEPQEKLSIKAKELIWEGTKIVVMKT